MGTLPCTYVAIKKVYLRIMKRFFFSCGYGKMRVESINNGNININFPHLIRINQYVSSMQ